MKFRSNRQMEEPEINFIPLIDLLLVILIFLMVTTTYNHLKGFQVELPTAESVSDNPINSQDIRIVVSNKHWQINEETFTDIAQLQQRLNQISQTTTETQPWIILSADHGTPYQKVIDTLQSVQKAGLSQVTLHTAENKK
ncbi:MAG: biopolymer transporter ExbD [Neisseriaceae bacterium]|nr:biopolymer transporter ExbD [Neisseriaceae bacterium]